LHSSAHFIACVHRVRTPRISVFRRYNKLTFTFTEPSRSFRPNIRPMFGLNRTSVHLYQRWPQPSPVLVVPIPTRKNDQCKIILMWIFVCCRSSDARAKPRAANNVDYIRTKSHDVGADRSGNDVRPTGTQDDSMINADSTSLRRQKPTAKRRLASFRLTLIYISHRRRLLEMTVGARTLVHPTPQSHDAPFPLFPSPSHSPFPSGPSPIP